MNGIHDMGGMHGFGPVPGKDDKAVFHEEWEGKCFGLARAVGALRLFSLDASRHSRERMPPALYLEATYYERILYGFQTLLAERGLVTAAEIAAREAELVDNA